LIKTQSLLKISNKKIVKTSMDTKNMRKVRKNSASTTMRNKKTIQKWSSRRRKFQLAKRSLMMLKKSSQRSRLLRESSCHIKKERGQLLKKTHPTATILVPQAARLMKRTPR